MIKLGFAGTGYINQIHARAAKGLKDISLSAVFSRSKKSGEQFANRFSIANSFTNYEEMLNVIDAVIIGLPTPLHKEYSIKALKFSKNVLCEKPIALELNDALEMRSDSDKSKKFLMIAHVLRFWPEYLALKKIIENGSAGNIKKIYAYRFASIPQWSSNNWLLDKNQSGGVPVDLLIHDIDFIRWMLGEPIKYYAVGNKNKEGLIVNSTVSFQYKNAIGVAEAGYVLGKDSRFRMGFNVITDNCVFDYSNLREPTLLVEGNDGILTTVLIEDIDAYSCQLSYFIECIKKNRAPKQIELSDAIESLRIAKGINSLIH